MRATQKSNIRIAIVESDPLRLIGLRALLDLVPDFELIHAPSDQIQVESGVDLMLLANPSSQIFLEAVARVGGTTGHDVPIVVTGPTADAEIIYQAIASGARGYVNETAPCTELVQAIRAVRDGLIWAPRHVVSMFIDRVGIFSTRNAGPRDTTFTIREKQVLEMLVGGRSNKEIAVPLGIEERTVKAHIAKLMRKVGVANRVALSVHAVSHSLVPAH